MPILKTFEPNNDGRDFVIGDLHGSLACFENLLENLAFDSTKDRMFSVGDLVDRGPDSLGCLALLRKPWFHAVLSNHEQMMLEAFRGGYMGQFWFQNGGMWGAEAWNVSRALEAKEAGRVEHMPLISDEDMELIDLLTFVENLPFMITINRPDGKKFHVIHAELPPGNVITDEILSDGQKVHALATKQNGDGDSFLWGRHLFYDFYRADLSNREKIIRTLKLRNGTAVFNDKLSHIISGHTIMQRPVTIVGQTNIDTCAYGSFGEQSYSGNIKVRGWCALTCIELGSWTFYQATEKEFRTVEPLTINKADLI
jgi:serine/threonine protein phosphatase 1